MTEKRPAVFLDRDGTILTERGYLLDERRMRFYPSAFRGLKRLKKAGFALVVITNQSAVGRGWLTLAGLKKIHATFSSRLHQRGVRLDGIYACPHGPDDGCACRKPSPLLARRAARAMGLDFARSYMIGDQVRDVEMARRINATGILVLTGGGRSARRKALRLGAHVARDLDGASRWIVKNVSKGKK